jgi:hypothetical protein
MRKLIVQQWVTMMNFIDSVDTMVLGANTYTQTLTQDRHALKPVGATAFGNGILRYEIIEGGPALRDGSATGADQP